MRTLEGFLCALTVVCQGLSEASNMTCDPCTYRRRVSWEVPPDQSLSTYIHEGRADHIKETLSSIVNTRVNRPRKFTST
jgi:hypothetical protein